MSKRDKTAAVPAKARATAPATDTAQLNKSFDVAKQSTNPIASTEGNTMRSLMLEAVKAQGNIDKKTNTISNKLLELARGFQKVDSIGVVNEDNAGAFVAACKDQESFIRSAEARGLRVDKLPRCWTQAKSNIKAALHYGIDLEKYSSEHALRKAVIKARASNATPDATAEALKAFKKQVECLPVDIALQLMKEANAAVTLALSALVPDEPIAPVHQEAA